MNARDSILLTYCALQNGESRAGELCPACGGGATKEHTLSVSNRQGTLLWKCHRASCSFAGATQISGTTREKCTTKIPDVRGMVGRAALKESVALEECTTELLKSKYNLAPVHITKYGIGWDTQTDRLAIPVEDFRGERLGVVLRSLSGQQPKTLTHTEQGAISWFINPHTTSLIIVEDQFSAIRASDFMSSAALLGTHLNDERIQEIKASGLSPVYLALDADAWGKTIKYVSTYRSQLRMIPVQLEKDIKDMTDEELTCLVSSL